MVNLFVSYVAIAGERQLWGNDVVIVDHVPESKADIDEIQAGIKFSILTVTELSVDQLVVQNWKVM
jgi:hypothetical protein